MRWLVRVLLVWAALIATSGEGRADDVGVTSARLTELANGRYALEADISPSKVGALRPPIVPERYQLFGRPRYTRGGAGLTVRYEFGGSDQPLRAGDVLLLPWARSAVLLTSRWLDGLVQRAMFPRGSTGIRIAIATLRPEVRSPARVAMDSSSAAWASTLHFVLRVLLGLTLALACARRSGPHSWP